MLFDEYREKPRLEHHQLERRDFLQTEATTPPLGIFPALQRGAAAELTLQPGDCLLMATDGFDEWQNADGRPFGMDQLRDEVRFHAALPAAGLVDRLHQTVSAFAGTVEQADDLTAVAVKRLP